MQTSDVFISYASEDRDRIQDLVVALETTDLSVWWDRHIHTGRAFDREIEQALDAARSAGGSGPTPAAHAARGQLSAGQAWSRDRSAR